MIETTVVILIVAVAAIYTGRRLLQQLKGEGCHGCNCKNKSRELAALFQKKDRSDTG